MNIIKYIKRLLRPTKKLTREELIVKAAHGSTYAIRKHGGALDKLAQYDRS
jgi:hypothetical protein